jgi:hypothetical protein
VERVPHPDAEASVILRENLRHIIVRDELSLMELREHPLSEGLLNRLEVYLQESGEYAVFPVAVSKQSVKVWMIVECLACCLYGEDSGEFTLVKAECLRQCSPSSTKEDGVELTVVPKEHP